MGAEIKTQISINTTSCNHGSAKVLFSCMGNPIKGISYRLRLLTGDIYKGISNAFGLTGILIMGEDDISKNHERQQPAWPLPYSAEKIDISIEVRRDDGSWKKIGSFQLEAGKQKQIHAESNSIALPFHMAIDH